MSSYPVRLIVSAAGLAFILASPADAAKARKHRHVAAPTVVNVYPHHRGAHLFPAGPVMYSNEYLGEDPDPFIRFQIWRDLGAHFGGAF